jgi:hypothetical protein
MVKHVLLFIGLFFLLGKSVTAQSNQTTVILEFGADEKTLSELTAKTEAILASVNRLSLAGEDTFGDDPGIAKLKELVSEQDLISPFDTLGTGVYRAGNNFEMPRMLLRPRGGSEFELIDLRFTYTPDGELLEVARASPAENIDRILSRNIEVNSREAQQAHNFLEAYAQAFENKSGEELRTIIDEEATIISGNKVSGRFEYRKQEASTYLERIKNRTFVTGNEIEILFEEPVFYRHPEMRGVLAIQTLQRWNTTAYSDVGYIFFVVDITGETPRLLFRQWQEEAFKVSRFSKMIPDPLAVSMRLVEVETGEKRSPKSGVIHISVAGANSVLLNPSLLREWMAGDVISISGDFSIEETAMTSDGLEMRFVVDSEEYVPSVSARITKQETSRLKTMAWEGDVYPDRVNHFMLRELKEDESPAPQAALNLIHPVEFSFNTDSVRADVANDVGQDLFSHLFPDTTGLLEMVEGGYRITYTREGFADTTRTLLVDMPQKIDIYLDPIITAPPPAAIMATAGKPGIWATYKYWIIGGGTAIVGGALAAILLQDDSGPGIPVPPGRPTGAN